MSYDIIQFFKLMMNGCDDMNYFSIPLRNAIFHMKHNFKRL